MALARRRPALGAGALGALGALGGAGIRVGRAAASEPRARDPAEAAARMAQLETDPEAALEAWGFAVEADGGSALSLVGRGDCPLGAPAPPARTPPSLRCCSTRGAWRAWPRGGP